MKPHANETRDLISYEVSHGDTADTQLCNDETLNVICYTHGGEQELVNRHIEKLIATY